MPGRPSQEALPDGHRLETVLYTSGASDIGTAVIYAVVFAALLDR
ncbi:MAG: hypothetical protein ACRDPY_51025 [Streptosporangiaceae bacterium]